MTQFRSPFYKKLLSTFFVTVIATAIIGLSVLPAQALTLRPLQVATTGNPAWPNKCGLKIGLLIDRSESISASEGTTMKNAAKGFVDALTGTPSQFAVASFGDTATQNLGFTSVTAAGDATTVKNSIGALAIGGTGLATNWDAAFQSQIGNGADVVVILTDGNPTRRGVNGEGGNGSSDPLGYNLDAGITSSNSVKAGGARVVAVGIGNDLDVSNLQAISGPTINDDYFTSSFDTLNTKLAELAKKICGGTVTVQKLVKNADGSYTPTNGWNYAATNAVTSPKTTAGLGTAEFKYDGTPKTTTITETLQSGYLVESVECLKNSTVIASSTTVAVTVTVNTDDIISCTFKNKPNVATLTINKTAVGDNATFPFTSTIPGKANFNVVTSGGSGTTGAFTIPAGTQYDVTESLPLGWNLTGLSCTGTTATIAGAKATFTAATDANIICTYTNTRQTATVTINKSTTGGNGTFPFTSTIPGKANFNLVTSGGSATTGSFTVNTGTYDITESVPGGWSLTNLDCTGAASVVKANPKLTVTLAQSQNVVCTFSNARDTANLTVKKIAVGGEGTFGFTTNTSLSNFNLSTIGGAAQTSTIAIPTGSYDITEVVPAGWDLTSLSCTNTTTVVANPKITINATKDADIVCTFTNTRHTANLTIVKNASGGNGTFGFTSTTPTNSSFNLTTVGGTATTGSFTIPTGSYDITENVPAGWDLTGLNCTNTTTSISGSKITITATKGANIVCTFSNTRQTANLTVKKVAVGGNSTFGFTSDSALGSFNLTTVGGAAQTSTVSIPTGNYTIAETQQAGWGLTGLSCTNASAQVAGNGVTITATKGADIVCTFTNARDTANLTVKKVSVGGNSTFGFTSNTPLGDFNLTTSGGTATTSTVAVPTGTFDISEVVPAGWDLTDVSCSGATPTITTKVTITAVKDANIVCTFTNTRHTANLVIKKVAVGGNSTFGFTSDTPLGNFNLTTSLGAAETLSVAVPTGSYDIAEVLPANWDLTGVICTGAQYSTSGTQVTIAATKDASIVCTFTNTRNTARLTVIKNTVGGNGTFGFTSNTPLGDFNLTTVNATATTSTVSLVTGTYDISEVVPAGWDLTDVSCTGATPTITTKVTITAVKDADIVCTFTNTRQSANVTVVKNTVGGNATFGFTSDTPLGDFGLTTSGGTATTSSVSIPTGSYAITETPLSGWTLTGLTCSGAQFTTSNSTVNITAVKDANIVCTFTNTRDTANVTVVKNAVGGNATFGFTSDTPLGDFGLTTVGATATTATVSIPTGIYTISETALAGWTLTDLDCSGAQFLEGADSLTIQASKNADIVCTFTNTRDTADITVIVNASGGNATFGFTSDTPLGDFDLTTVGGTATTATVSIPTGDFEVEEIVPAGWTLTSVGCSVTAPISIVPTAVNPQTNFTATKGSHVVCTFNNTKDPEVLGTVVTRPVEVKGTSVSTLAVTGSYPVTLAATALVFVLAGALALRTSRRKKGVLEI